MIWKTTLWVLLVAGAVNLAAGKNIDETSQLQRLVDSQQVVDLGGRVWILRDAIRLGSHHNGRVIRNGTLLTLPDLSDSPRYGIVEILRGTKWRGATWPDLPVDITFEDVTFLGGQTDWTDDAALNQDRSRSQGYFCAGIIALNGSRIDRIHCLRCKFRGLFQGVAAQETTRLLVSDCDFEHIAGAAVVSAHSVDNRLQQVHTVEQSRFDDCGQGFNFSSADEREFQDGYATPQARVDSCTFTNILGRTKVHARWDFTGTHMTFRQTRLIPNQFAAINFPSARNVLIEDSVIEGYLVGGIGVPAVEAENAARPEIRLVRTRIRGGQMAINASCRYSLESCEISDCLLPWGSTRPVSAANTPIINPATMESIARQFCACRAIVKNWNQLHRTRHNLDRYWYYVPSVKEKILEFESAHPSLADPVR